MSQQTVFEIPERLTIAQSQQVYDQLNALLESDDVDGVVLDASEVVKVDAAGLQLLLCFYRTAAKFHKPIAWRSPSEEFIESAHILGLDEELALVQTVN